MDAVVDLLARVPAEIRRVGGSLPARLVVLAVAVLANIGFYLPSVPDGVPGAGVPGLDKVVHVGVFALTVWALGRVLAPRKRFPMGWVVIAAVLHALLIELVQALLLPERSPDGADLVADLAGVALGLGAWILERWLRVRREETGDEDREGDPDEDVLAEEPISR